LSGTSSSSTSGSTISVEQQYEILDSVSVSMGSADGPELQNWGNESISFCEWEGIDCDESGNINVLYLENHNITGTLPLS